MGLALSKPGEKGQLCFLQSTQPVSPSFCRPETYLETSFIKLGEFPFIPSSLTYDIQSSVLSCSVHLAPASFPLPFKLRIRGGWRDESGLRALAAGVLSILPNPGSSQSLAPGIPCPLLDARHLHLRVHILTHTYTQLNKINLKKQIGNKMIKGFYFVNTVGLGLVWFLTRRYPRQIPLGHGVPLSLGVVVLVNP